jgi:tetratricopeptide (TPR) repeat protein
MLSGRSGAAVLLCRCLHLLLLIRFRYACCRSHTAALLFILQALSCYQEAVRLRPCYADAFTGMGVVLKELKRRPEAEACFEAVVRLRPNCALAHGNLAGGRDTGKVHVC